jgi:hypothetical protein
MFRAHISGPDPQTVALEVREVQLARYTFLPPVDGLNVSPKHLQAW